MMKNIQPRSIHLKKISFAEYQIIYHINDGYLVKNLSSIQSEHILLFQKFSNKIQQMNLMMVDGIFPILLADVALETLLKNISSFKEYIQLKKEVNNGNIRNDAIYLNYKFKSYINYLLFSTIIFEEIYKGEIQNNIVYYLKNNSGEIEYYSIYEQHKLRSLLLDKFFLTINLNKSSITKEEVLLNFQILLAN